MESIDFEKLMNQAIELSMAYAPKLVLALITLLVGFWIIGKISKGVEKVLTFQKVEPTLVHFLRNLVSVVLKVLLAISVASMIGIATSSFIAMLGAAGLAIGLALQGSLSNFAGGVLILFFKPFKVNDVIEAQGYLGRVKEIQIFNTILTTLDNQRIIIPNGALSNGSIKNVFAEPTRRVDLTFGISYDDDILRAKSILKDVIDDQEFVLDDHDKEIYVSEHADSSVNILVRIWTKSETYWDVYFGMYEKVKLAFDKEGVTIPYPQRDVHIHQTGPAA
ncbi:mechanosensitive ion channel family protein [Pleionea sp. CnH1-48]|uniref:mechanosensitive ion channel family protein n=1 Tax=Pleionea sp. CnH1-48 TaxID=2954494 RepID=UPI0020970CB8|nr:mechanosensitive ion channel domain-containing protein [Pleionea sp. CnH1-48]MCO7226024.1 mechanosensitive ion channel [Pleionea sp. CnH1-48]